MVSGWCLTLWLLGCRGTPSCVQGLWTGLDWDIQCCIHAIIGLWCHYTCWSLVMMTELEMRWGAMEEHGIEPYAWIWDLPEYIVLWPQGGAICVGQPSLPISPACHGNPALRDHDVTVSRYLVPVDILSHPHDVLICQAQQDSHWWLHGAVSPATVAWLGHFHLKHCSFLLIMVEAVQKSHSKRNSPHCCCHARLHLGDFCLGHPGNVTTSLPIQWDVSNILSSEQAVLPACLGHQSWYSMEWLHSYITSFTIAHTLSLIKTRSVTPVQALSSIARQH